MSHPVTHPLVPVTPPDWTMVARFDVDIKAQPQERARVTSRGNYTPAQTTEFRNALGWLARAAMRGRKPSEARLALALLAERRSRAHAIDSDNIIKAVGDALQGIVYVNDNQIDEHVMKFRRHAATDRVTIAVYEIPEE